MKASFIAQQAQSQAALTDQLRELIPFAHRLGLYDAADFLRGYVGRVTEAGEG